VPGTHLDQEPERRTPLPESEGLLFDEDFLQE